MVLANVPSERKPERGYVRQNHPFRKPPFYLNMAFFSPRCRLDGAFLSRQRFLCGIALTEKKKAYTTTTERKSFGELFWSERKTFQAGGGYKNPIKTRKTISTTEIFPLWTPFFSAKKSSALEQGGVRFLFPSLKRAVKSDVSSADFTAKSHFQMLLPFKMSPLRPPDPPKLVRPDKWDVSQAAFRGSNASDGHIVLLPRACSLHPEGQRHTN